MSEQNGTNNKVAALKPLLKFLGGVGGRILLTLVFAVIIFAILGLLAGTDNSTIAVIVAIPCAYFGWKTLNKFTPDMILWFHGISALIIYYFIKGLISLIIGVFATPFYLGKKISGAIMKALTETM